MTEVAAVPNGKVKAMIYVPEGMHAAVRLLAARRGCRISDIYAEATAAFLAEAEAPQRRKADDGRDNADAPAIVGLARAVERQALLVEELVDKVDGMVSIDAATVGLPPMMLDTAGWAVASVLRLLLTAGEEGAVKSEIAEFGRTGKLRLGLMSALYSLRGVGLARSMGQRWWACWPPVQGDKHPFVRGKHAEYPAGKLTGP